VKEKNHLYILKVDIEGSEWIYLMKCVKILEHGKRQMIIREHLVLQRFRLISLLIELHVISDEFMINLIDCIDEFELYPFSKEDNLHGAACGNSPHVL
jgi:hypothetical protein